MVKMGSITVSAVYAVSTSSLICVRLLLVPTFSRKGKACGFGRAVAYDAR